MKVKNLTKQMRKVICTLLTAALVFTDTGMTTFAKQTLIAEEALVAEETLTAEEAAQTEEPQQETTAEPAENPLTEKEAVEWEHSDGEENKEQILERDSDTEENTTKEQTNKKDAENASAEEITTENAATEDIATESVMTEENTEDNSEAEVAEETLKLNIADGTYKENGNDITWVIDADGKLTVRGTGDFAASSQVYNRERAPWYEFRSEITTAVINVTGMTDAIAMFYNCNNLTEVDISDFDTSSITNMSYMFSGCSSLATLDLSKFDTSNVTKMSAMFGSCSSLTTLDLSKFDTSSVTDMGSMFNDCKSLTSLDLSKFDTSSVTSMQAMFSQCENLTELDLSKLDTSKVTFMNSMFSQCKSLTELDLSKFDTGKVTIMNQMFAGCNSLKSVNMNGFDTSKVTSMWEMFYNCSSLTSVNMNGFDTSKVTDMHRMFVGCTNLESADISGFDTSKVTDMHEMFYNCSKLATVDVSSFDTSKVTNMERMFCGCSSLTSVDVSGFDTSSVTNMKEMFSSCSKLTAVNVSRFNTSNVTNMKQMFDGCSSLTNINLSSFDTSKVTTMGWMFMSCSSLTSIDLSGFDLTSVEDGDSTWGGRYLERCNALKTVYTPCNLQHSVSLPSGNWYQYYDAEKEENNEQFKVTSLPQNLDYSIFLMNLNNLKDNEKPIVLNRRLKTTKIETVYEYGDDLDFADMTVKLYENDGTVQKITDYTTNAADLNMYEAGEKELTVGFDGLTDTITITVLPEVEGEDIASGSYQNITWSISAAGKLTVTGTGEVSAGGKESAPWYPYCLEIKTAEINVENMTNASYMFYGCSMLKKVDFSGFKTDKVRYMDGMFYDCYRLKNLNLGGFETTAVERMNYMFYNCYSLTKLDLSSFDTGRVENMCDMFYNCYSLTEIDMSNFDTSNVEDMANMFYGCNGLKNLDMSSFDTSSVTDMCYMFENCGSLVELDFSNFDTSNVTNMSALLRGCSSLESVNLDGFDTSNAINMMDMFRGCSSLTSIDVSGFDTSNAENMEGMFYDCGGLKNLDLSSFDTSKVTNMYSMFRGDSSLTSVDVSGFDTSNVTAMDSMFSNCSSLTSIDVSGFNTSNVTNIGNMFDGCSSLTSIDVSSFDTSNVTQMGMMFRGCNSLTSVDISGFDASNVTYIYGMFMDCSNLTQIYTPYNISPSLNLDYTLPNGTWYDLDENTYTTFPTGKAKSVLLAKGAKPSVIDHITVIKTKTVYNRGDVINTDDLRVTYYGSDGTVQKLSPSEYTTNLAQLDTWTAGDQTLIVTYKDKVLKAEIKLTIKANGESGETEESSKTEESSGSTESSETGGSKPEGSETEDSKTESSETGGSKPEGSETEESSLEDEDDSPFASSERTDLTVNGAIADIKTKVYDQNAYEPVVKVTATEGKKKTTLIEGADYRVIYENNVNAGTGKVIVRGNGVYRGEIEKTFTISKKSVKKLKVIAGGIVGDVKDAKTAELPVCVYDGTKLLELDKDYTLSDLKAVKAGAHVTVTGIVNYEGAVTAKLEVYPSDTNLILPANVRLNGLDDNTAAYTGKPIKPEPIVTVGGATLKGKDYKVQYQNNKNAGTAFVIVTGKGQYKGKVVVPFTIKAETVASNAVSIKAITAKTYNGKLQKPSVNVTIQKDGKAKKLSKKDYAVTYKDNLHAGDATVTVTGKGNYAGFSATAAFKINPQQIKKASLNGTKGSLTLTYNKRKLKEGHDYEITAYGAEKKNKVEVTIAGNGDFTGELKKTVKTQ